MPRVRYATLNDAYAQLLPSLDMPSDHAPCIVDFALPVLTDVAPLAPNAQAAMPTGAAPQPSADEAAEDDDDSAAGRRAAWRRALISSTGSHGEMYEATQARHLEALRERLLAVIRQGSAKVLAFYHAHSSHSNSVLYGGCAGEPQCTLAAVRDDVTWLLLLADKKTEVGEQVGARQPYEVLLSH